jgi:cytohesin
MIELLLHAGAQPNRRDSLGDTPLHRLAQGATALGTPEGDVATILIRGGASVNARNQHGITPLHATVAPGKLDVARILLTAGANIEAGASLEAPGERLQAGDPCGWSRSRDGGRRTSDVTPLHLAGFHLSGHSNSVEFADLLLRAGANPQARTKHRSTPLDLARTQVDFLRHWRATVPAAWAVREYRDEWERGDERLPLFERLITTYSGPAGL